MIDAIRAAIRAIGPANTNPYRRDTAEDQGFDRGVEAALAVVEELGPSVSKGWISPATAELMAAAIRVDDEMDHSGDTGRIDGHGHDQDNCWACKCRAALDAYKEIK